MLLSTIAPVVVPVMGAVVVVVEVDDDVLVEDVVVVEPAVDFGIPKRRNFAIMALSSFKAGSRMSWFAVVTAPAVGSTSVARFPEGSPRNSSASDSRSPVENVESMTICFVASTMKALIESGFRSPSARSMRAWKKASWRRILLRSPRPS